MTTLTSTIFFILYLIYFSSISAACDMVGCLTCAAGSQTTCSSCKEGFTLSKTNQCISAMCEMYQSYQQTDNNGNGKCVSICGENQYSSPTLQVCQSSQECSQSFVQAYGVNQGSQIKNIIYRNQGELYLLYDTFVNSYSVDQKSFERSFSFPSISVATIKAFNNDIYLLTRNNIVYKWQPENDAQVKIMTLTSGTFKTSSDFLQMRGDESRAAISSFSDVNSILYFTELVQNGGEPIFQIQFTNDSLYFLNKYYVILQNTTTFGVYLYHLIINSSILQMEKINQSELCAESNGLLIQLEIVDDISYAIFSNTLSLFQIYSSTNYSIITQTYQPQVIQQIQQNLSNIQYNILAVQLQNMILIYACPSMKLLTSITFTNTLIYFILVPQINNSSFQMHVLNNSTFLSTHSIQSTSKQDFISLDYDQTSIQYSNILIPSPKLLKYLVINEWETLTVYFQDVQTIYIPDLDTVGISLDFNQKKYQNQASISSISITTKYHFIITCSVDGTIVVWSNIDTFSPVFYFSITRSGSQQCISSFIFQEMYGVVLLTNEVFFFNIFNEYINCSYPISSSTLQRIVAISDQYIYIILGDQLYIFDNICQDPYSINVNQSYATLKALFVTKEDQLVLINQTNLISLFSLPIGSQPLRTYQNKVQISTSKLFDNNFGGKLNITLIILSQYYSIGFMLSFCDVNYRIVLLNENLVEVFSQIQSDGNLIHVYSLDLKLFFFILKLLDTTQTYIYRSMCLNISTGIIELVGNHYYILDYGQLVKKVNTIGIEVYVIVCILPLSYTTMVIELSWSSLGAAISDNERTRYGRFAYTPAQYVITKNSDINQKFLVVGCLSGQARILPTPNDSGAVKRVFKSLSNNTYDIIQQVLPSFSLGRYFVSTSSVYVFSMFTDEQLEVLSFQSNSQGTINNVIQTHASVLNQLFIACTKQEIIVRDYSVANTIKSWNILSKSSSKLTFIKGFYFQENTKTIFIFGSGIFYTDKTLTEMNILVQNDYNLSSCLFLTKVLICKLNSDQILFYLRSANQLYLSAKQTVSPLMGNFNLFADEAIGILFAYNQRIEIYTIVGTLLTSSNLITQAIMKIYICNAHFIIMTYSASYVLKRATLDLVTYFSASGGGFLGGLFIDSYNIFVYFSDEIRYGQAFFYSLDSYSSVGSDTNTFSNNGIGKVIKLIYDSDSQMLNYIDTYGNNQNIIFSTTRTTDNTLAVEEIQEGLTQAPVDQVVDFNSNEFFIHNGLRVWKFNYNLHTRPLQQLMNSYKRPFFNMQAPNTQDYYHYIVDQYNNIFLYMDFTVSFSCHFKEEIKNIVQFEQFTQNIIAIIFSSSIAVYIGDEFMNYCEDNYSYKIDNTQLRDFLSTQNDRTVFVTFNNTIFDFDFLNNLKYSSYHMRDQDYITYCIFVEDENDNSNQMLLYGTIIGQYGIYSFKTRTHSPLKSVISDETSVVFIQYLALQNQLFVHKSGLMVSTSILDNHSLSLNSEQSFQNAQPKVQEIKIIKIDPKNNRYFLSFAMQKRAEVRNLNTHELIIQLMFPDDEWKRIDINNTYIILSAAFQLNFYSSATYSFISRVRRYNRKDKITDIQLVNENKVIAVFNNRIETLLINSNQSVSLIDTLTLNNGQIIHLYLDSNTNALSFMGYATNQIFQKTISLNLFDSSLQSTSSCITSINYTNNAQAQNSFELAYTSSLSISYLILVYISGEISSISFLNKNQVSVFIRPPSADDNLLNIRKDSFSNLPFNIQIIGFKFLLVEQETNITFSSTSMNITMQDLEISHQQIKQGTQIWFENKSIVQIQNLLINNITLTKVHNKKIRKLNEYQQSQTDSSNANRILNSNSNLFAYSLLNFHNCSYVLISNLTLIDSTFSSASNQILLSSQGTIKFIIYNLTIINTSFNGLLSFEVDQSVDIKKMLIINCNKPSNGIVLVSENWYMLQFIGVSLIHINQMNSTNNEDILLIYASKKYDLNDRTISLKSDNFTFSNSVINSQQYLSQISSNNQVNLIYLYSSYITITNLTCISNQGNIFSSEATNLLVSNSLFSKILGVTGSALQLNSIEEVSIQNCTFSSNRAYASGGALQITDCSNASIDENTFFTHNQALIGGAIRFIFTFINIVDSSKIIAQFSSNTAQLFGNNIATFLNNFRVSILTLNNNSSNSYQVNQTFNGTIFSDQIQSPILIQNVQSGGQLLLCVQLLDDDGKVFTIEPKSYFSDLYSTIIINELEKYEIELSSSESISSEDLLEIKGQSLLTIKEYQTDLNSFIFNSLTLTSYPEQMISNVYLKLQFHPYIQSTKLPISIKFRDCLSGEIYVSSVYTSENDTTSKDTTIIACKKCESGTYSLRSDNFDSLKLIQKEEEYGLCKKCPDSATQCEGSTIILEKGYWRINNKSEIIVQCTLFPYACDEGSPHSKYGCIEGYVGPLCETCDIGGKVWKGERYTSSFSTKSCSKCLRFSYQIAFVVFGATILLIYLATNIFLFMNSYIHNSICSYLRLMNIIPYSKSSTLDESTFFIKALMNYLQLSSHLFSFQSSSYMPDLAQSVPDSAGQPVTKAISSSSCLYGIAAIEHYGEEKLRTIFQTVYPLITLLILLLIFKILQNLKLWSVGKFHKYTMINVVFFFFQPDAIGFFTHALTCKNIGGQTYQQINLLLSCSNPEYRTFTLALIVPNLIFWGIFPAILFLYLKKSMKSQQNLQYCTFKYRFGYFYLGFKKEYYYWEFIRIYFRTLVVVLVTLMKQYGMTIYVLIVIFIFIYIFAVQKFLPFESTLVSKLEFISYVILVPSIFLYQINQIYLWNITSLFIACIHFGYIFYTLVIIAQFKLNNQNNTKFQKLLHKICKIVLPSKIYFAITKTKYKNFFTVLLRWRKIYENLSFLTKNPNGPSVSPTCINDPLKFFIKNKTASIEIIESKISNINASRQKFDLQTPCSSSMSLTPRHKRQNDEHLSQSKFQILNIQDLKNKFPILNNDSNMILRDTFHELTSPQNQSNKALNSPPILKPIVKERKNVSEQQLAILPNNTEKDQESQEMEKVSVFEEENNEKNSDSVQQFPIAKYKTIKDDIPIFSAPQSPKAKSFLNQKSFKINKNS